MLDRASQRAFETKYRKGSLSSPMVWSTAMVLPKTGGVPSVKISTRKRGWCVHVTAARCPEGWNMLKPPLHRNTISKLHLVDLAGSEKSGSDERKQAKDWKSWRMQQKRVLAFGFWKSPLEFSVLICVMKNFRINLATKGSWVLSGNSPQMEHHGIPPTSTPKKWWSRKEWPLTKEFGEFKVT